MYSADMAAANPNTDDKVTLLVGNERIECSRNTLKLHSFYFSAMFSGNFQESNMKVITLKDIDGKAMEELIRIMIDKIYISGVTDVVKVLTLSDMLLFDRIKEELSQDVIKTISHKNCLSLWMALRQIKVFPLIWKAKSLSLTSFDYQRLHGSINSLELPDLLTYLGHKNLQCDSEVHVFETLLEWIKTNNYRMDEVPLLEILGLAMNFHDASKDQVEEMRRRAEVLLEYDVVEVLDYIIYFKNKLRLNRNNRASLRASYWLNVQGRYLPKYLCLMSNATKLEIFYHGAHDHKYMKKIASIPNTIQNLEGFGIVVYKMAIYIIGGEFTLGKGRWNERIYELDFDGENLIESKYDCGIKRRHFECCLIGDMLYIVGGTGQFRKKENTLEFFNFKTGEWGPKKIPLPSELNTSCAKCCNFNNKLFLYDFFFFAYFLSHDDMEFRRVMIDPSLIRDKLSSMTAYKGNLFLIGNNKLVEMEINSDGNAFKEKNRHDLSSPPPGRLISSVGSHDIVYSFYVDEVDNIVHLDCLNLDSLTRTIIKKLELRNAIDNKDNQEYKFKSNMKMFMYHHHKLVESADLLEDKDIDEIMIKLNQGLKRISGEQVLAVHRY